MAILKYITNLFSILNRLYKCDYILIVLLIKQTNKQTNLLLSKGDPETTNWAPSRIQEV